MKRPPLSVLRTKFKLPYSTLNLLLEYEKLTDPLTKDGRANLAKQITASGGGATLTPLLAETASGGAASLTPVTAETPSDFVLREIEIVVRQLKESESILLFSPEHCQPFVEFNKYYGFDGEIFIAKGYYTKYIGKVLCDEKIEFSEVSMK